MTFQDKSLSDKSLAVNRRFVYCLGVFEAMKPAKIKECAFQQ
jgi:hypothetical protein